MAPADDGLFGPGSVTWRVHLEPVLWVGGFRALLLQSLHPRVMRGTYQNSALFDPAKAWARFQRTVEFVGIRTFASTAEVEAASARVRRLHARAARARPGHRRDVRPRRARTAALGAQHGDRLVRRGGAPGRHPRRRRGGGLPRRERARGAGDRVGGRALVPRRHAGLPGSHAARAEAHRRGPPGCGQPVRAAGRHADDPQAGLLGGGHTVAGHAAALGPPDVRAARPAQHRPGHHRRPARRCAG